MITKLERDARFAELSEILGSGGAESWLIEMSRLEGEREELAAVARMGQGFAELGQGIRDAVELRDDSGGVLARLRDRVRWLEREMEYLKRDRLR